MLIILALIIFWKIFFTGKIKKQRVRFPTWPYKLIYSDEKNFTAGSKILLSQKYNLSGKPDLIYQNIFTKNLIVIELKSSKRGNKKNLRSGDFLQLVSYFIIVEDCLQIKPRRGYLIYSDCMFRVPNKKKFRTQVFDSLKKMRAMLKNSNLEHKKNFAVCKNCICYNSVCDK